MQKIDIIALVSQIIILTIFLIPHTLTHTHTHIYIYNSQCVSYSLLILNLYYGNIKGLR